MSFFNFYIPTFVFAALNLLVLYLILRKVLFGPVTKMMEKRTQTIKNSLDNAQAQQNEASELKQQYEASIKTARLEYDRIIASAHAKGEQQYEEMVADAKREAEFVLSAGRERIEQEHAAMLKELRNQVATLALAAASKVIEANMSTEANRALVQKFLDEEGAA